MLRRLEKRILVDLPSLEAREAMLKQYLPPLIHSVEGSVEIKTEIDYEELAKVQCVCMGNQTREVLNNDMYYNSQCCFHADVF